MYRYIDAIKNHFLNTSIFIFCLTVLFSSCEEQIDDLWNSDDDIESVSPLIGDWYADSIKSFYSCVKTADSTSNLMDDIYIDNYNIWFLSDGSLQFYFDQSVNLKNECEYYYGTWDNNTGCVNSYYYYNGDFDYTPIEFCNSYYEHDKYNISTSDCQQNVALQGNWTADENDSTVTITMDSVCINSFGNPSYLTSANTCEELEDGKYFPSLEKTFSYSVDPQTGNVDLEGSWFDDDSSCLIFHMSLQ